MKKEDWKLINSAMKLSNAVSGFADNQLSEKLAGIVKLHSALAVASGFIPIPGADIAAAATNIWTMYIRINNEVGIPFKENIIKSIGSAVATNLGAAVAASLILGTFFKFVPIVGTVGGGAVVAATIYSVTVVSGIIYMNALAMLKDFDKSEETEEELKNNVNEILKDKSLIKDMLKDAKEDYKSSKDDEDNDEDDEDDNELQKI